MAFYLGNEKNRVRINGILYDVQFNSSLIEVFEGIKLISSDNYTLLDSTGTYLTAKGDN